MTQLELLEAAQGSPPEVDIARVARALAARTG
jgi:hypothetical protein